MLYPPQKIIKGMGKLNQQKYFHYHEAVGHNTGECRDLLKKLWKLYDDEMLDKFVSRPQKNGNQRREEAPRRNEAPHQNEAE